MMAKSDKKQVNRRERTGGIVYVSVIFLAGISLACCLAFSTHDVKRIFFQKDVVNIKMKRQQNFKKIQDEHVVVCDLLTSKIMRYDPGVNAVFEKDEIQYMINDLRRQYEENKNDRRHLVFLHMSSFYEMWFNDRQHVWTLGSNLSYLKRNLEECELGLQKKNQSINQRR